MAKAPSWRKLIDSDLAAYQSEQQTRNDPRNREAEGWAFIKALVDDGVELSDEEQVIILNDFIRTGGTSFTQPLAPEEAEPTAVADSPVEAQDDRSLLRRGLSAYSRIPALPGAAMAGGLEMALGTRNNPEDIPAPTEGDLLSEKVNLITEGHNADLSPDQLANSYYEREMARRASSGGSYTLEERLSSAGLNVYHGIQATEAMEDASNAYVDLLGAEDRPLHTFATPRELATGTMPSNETLQRRKDEFIASRTAALNKAEAAMRVSGPKAAEHGNIVGRNTLVGDVADGLVSAATQLPETAASIGGALLGSRIGQAVGSPGVGAAIGGTVGSTFTYTRARNMKRYEIKDEPLTDEEKDDYATLSAAIEFAPQVVMSTISGGTMAAAGRTAIGSRFAETVMPELRRALGRLTSSRGAQLAIASLGEGIDETLANELRVFADKQIAERNLASTPEGQKFFEEQVAENEANRESDRRASFIGGVIGGTTAAGPIAQVNHMQKQRAAAKALEALEQVQADTRLRLDAAAEAGAAVQERAAPTESNDDALHAEIAAEQERIARETKEAEEDAAWEQRNLERAREQNWEEARIPYENAIDLAREDVATLQEAVEDGARDSQTLNDFAAATARLRQAEEALANFEATRPRPEAQGEMTPAPEPPPPPPAPEPTPESLEAQRVERAEQGKRIEAIRKRQEELKKKEEDKKAKEAKAAEKAANARRRAITDEVIAANPDATPAQLDQIIEARMMEPAADPAPAEAEKALRAKVKSVKARLDRGRKPSGRAETRRIENWLKANPQATVDQAVEALRGGEQVAAATPQRVQRAEAREQQRARTFRQPATQARPTKPDAQLTDAEVDAMAERYASLGMADTGQPRTGRNAEQQKAKDSAILKALVNSSHEGSTGVQELILQGRLRLVPNASSVGMAEQGRAAEYDVASDVMYVYTDSLSNPNDAVPVIVRGLHEATHSGQFAGSEARRELYRAFLGDNKTSKAAAILRDAAGKGNTLAAAALRKAQADTEQRRAAGEENPARFEDLELVAYFTGEVAASRGTALGSVGGVMRDITTAARSWVRESIPGLDLQITAGDLNTAAAYVGQEVAGDVRQGDAVAPRTNVAADEEDYSLGMLGGRQATDADLARQQGRMYTPEVDGLERFEFDDSVAELTEDGETWKAIAAGESTPLNEVWSHPEFERQYPELANSLVVQVDPNMQPDAGGAYMDGKILVPPTIDFLVARDSEDVRNTILHEVQHAIQELEGFVPGTNPLNFMPESAGAIRAHDQQRVARMAKDFNLKRAVENLPPEDRARWEATGWADSEEAPHLFMSGNFHKNTSNPNDVRMGDRYNTALKNLRQSTADYRKAYERAVRIYLRDRGEAEARNVSERSRMTPAERDALPFESTIGEDVGIAADELLDTRPFVDRPEAAPVASVTPAEVELRETLGMALHGTPTTFQPEGSNRFGVFRDDKMGTGEGAQAVGWGHYLTDAFRVANGKYREGLLQRRTNESWRSPELSSTPLGVVYNYVDLRTLTNRNATPDEILSGVSSAMGNRISSLETQLADGNTEEMSPRRLLRLQNDLENLRTAKDIVDNSTMDQIQQLLAPAEEGDTGQVYYVDIRNKEGLANWDAPIAEQPESVQAAIEAALQKFVPSRERAQIAQGIEARPFGRVYRTLSDYVSKNTRMMDRLKGILGGGTASAQSSNAQQALSKFLHSNGVPGHSFSPITVAEAGYNNYVVYDPSSLTITGREPFERGVPYRDTIRDYESRSDRLRREQEEDARQRIRDEIPSQPLELETLGMAAVPVEVTAYHGTNAQFDRFEQLSGEVGFHFGGNREQAEHRSRNGRIIEARLSFNNPIQMEDIFYWGGKDLVRELRRKGLVPDSTLQALDAAIQRAPEEAIASGERLSTQEAVAVADTLLDEGYDGIVYRNRGEGGGTAYIALSNNSISYPPSGTSEGRSAQARNQDEAIVLGMAAPTDSKTRAQQIRELTDIEMQRDLTEFEQRRLDRLLAEREAALNDPTPRLDSQGVLRDMYGRDISPENELAAEEWRRNNYEHDSGIIVPYEDIDAMFQQWTNAELQELVNDPWDVFEGTELYDRYTLPGNEPDDPYSTEVRTSLAEEMAAIALSRRPRETGGVLPFRRREDTTLGMSSDTPSPRKIADTSEMRKARAMEKVRGALFNSRGMGEEVLNLVELARSYPAADTMAAEVLVRDYQKALDALALERGTTARDLSREIADKLDELGHEDTSYSENKAAWADVLSEYGEAGDVLMRMRNRADALTIHMLQQREQQGGDLTPEELRAYKAAAANLGRYVHRMYAAGRGKAGKRYSKALWDAHVKKLQGKKELSLLEKQNAAVVDRAINVLVDRLYIPDDESLYDMSREDLEMLYGTWKGTDPAGIDTDELVARLSDMREAVNGDTEAMQNHAEQTVRELLHLAEEATSPMGKFYRGNKLDRGILKQRKNIDPALRELMGEIRDPGMALLGTISKQSEFVAKNSMLLAIRDMVGDHVQPPDQGGSAVVRDNRMVKLNGEGYGPLEGWYVSPDMELMLRDTNASFSTLSDALNAIGANPDAAARGIFQKAADGWMKAAGYTKSASILGNPALYALNFAGSVDTMLQNGNFTNPAVQAQAIQEGLQLVAYAFNPSKSTEATRLLAKYNVIDSAQIGELKSMSHQQLQQHIKSLYTEGGRKRRIAASVVRGTKEMYAMMDVWAKIANFHQNVNDLTAYNEAEGLGWTQDDIYKKASATTKRTNFTYSRVAPLVKSMERGGLTMFGTYFYETFRTQVESIREIGRDLQLAKDATTPDGRAIGRNRAIKRGLGMLASYAIKYGATAMLNKLMFGDDEEKWYNIRGLLPDFMHNQDFLPFGVDENGLQIVYPISRVDAYGPVTDIMREIMLGNGDPEKVMEQLADLLIFPRIGGVVMQQVMGEGREPTTQQLFPETYGKAVNLVSLIPGLDQTEAARLQQSFFNIAETALPGVVSSWRNNVARPHGDDLASQAALFMTYSGFRAYALDPARQARGVGFEYKDFVREAQDGVKSYLKTQTNVTADDMRRMVVDIAADEKKQWDKARRIYLGMQALGMSSAEINKVMNESGIPKTVIADVKKGVFVPRAVSVRSLDGYKEAIKKGKSAKERSEIETRWKATIDLMKEVLADE